MLICRMTLELTAPLHIGGGSDPLQDDAVERDAMGLWRIPGTSLAGVLRDYSERSLGREQTEILFGSRSQRGCSASKIWCSDGRLLDFDYAEKGGTAYEKAVRGDLVQIPVGPYVRDHVRLDLDRGATDEGGKFDEEIVPPGTRFALELKLDGWERELSAEEEQAFLQLCAQLGEGELSLGGGRGSGQGRAKAHYVEVRRFDLTSPAGMQAYLNLRHGTSFQSSDGIKCSLPQALKTSSDSGTSFDLTLPLVCAGPLLPGGMNQDETEIDLVCLKTPVLNYAKKAVRYEYTLAGSALKGAVRHRCYEIAEIKYGREKAQALLDTLFGYVKAPPKGRGQDGDEAGTENVTAAAPRSEDGRAGKLRFGEVLIRNVKSVTVQHVAIDRFTGGALEGALFDEAPLWQEGLSFDFNLQGESLEIVESEVLCHALLDLSEGRLPLGGGVNRGNGIVKIKGLEQGLGKALSGAVCHGAVAGEAVSDAAQFMNKIAESAA